MVKFFYRENGKIYNAREYFKLNSDKYYQIIIILKHYLEEYFDKKTEPTEINFIMYPHLGDEIFEDDRIAAEMLEQGKDELNEIRGVAICIRNDTDQNLILRDGYRDLKLIYIGLAENYSLLINILSSLHELNHLRNPFNSAVDYGIEFHGTTYKENKRKFIEYNVRNILNEYYANFRSYSYLKDLRANFSFDISDLNPILTNSMYSLKKGAEKLKTNLIKLKNMEANYFRFHQYLQSIFYFYENFLKFLGKWDGMLQCGENVDKFNGIYEYFKSIMKENAQETLIPLSNTIKEITNPALQETREIQKFYDLFMTIANEYPSILREMTEK